MEYQDQMKHISSYASKLLRNKFGRGPESCHGTLCNNYIVLYVRGFLTPMEEVLIEQGQNEYVDHAREVIISQVLEELKGVVQVSLNIEVEESYHDWNIHNNSGVIILVLEKDLNTKTIEGSFPIDALEREISRISTTVQKTPESINVYLLSEKIILVERNGILVPIEQALIKRGYVQELKTTKDNLEKSYFHHDSHLKDILKTNVIDLFIDWDFKGDKSLICIILR